MTYLLSYTHGSFPTHLAPSEKGSALKGKNLLPWGANSFLLEYAPFQKGSKNSLTDLPPWKVCQFLIITPQEFKHLQPALFVHISGVVTLSDFRVIYEDKEYLGYHIFLARARIGLARSEYKYI